MGLWWMLSCAATAPAPADPGPPAVPDAPAPVPPLFGVTTDRTRYAPGDAVWLRPWGPGPDASPDAVWVSRLRDPQGAVHATRTWGRSTRGGLLWLPRDAVPGTWSVELERDGLRTSWPLRVGPGDPSVPPVEGASPPLLVQAEATRDAARSCTLTVRTAGPDGAPVGAALSIAVVEAATAEPLVPTAAALWRAEVLPAANGGWGLQAPAPVVLGPLPRPAVEASLLAARPELDRCRDDARARDALAEGVVVVKFSVAADGAVVESRGIDDRASDPEFGRCATAALGRQILPPSAGLTIVSTPVHLRAEDEEGRGFRTSGGATAWFDPSASTGADGTGRFQLPIPDDRAWVVVVRGLAGVHAGEALVRGCGAAR